MAKDPRKVYDEDLRNLGKNIAKISGLEGGQNFLGQIYLAACNSVDRKKSFLEVDKQLVRVFASIVKETAAFNSDNTKYHETQIHEEAIKFLKGCTGPSTSRPARLPGPRTLYELTVDEAKKSGISYNETGRMLSLASESLTAKLEASADELGKILPQVHRFSLEQRAVYIIKNCIKLQFSKQF